MLHAPQRMRVTLPTQPPTRASTSKVALAASQATALRSSSRSPMTCSHTQGSRQQRYDHMHSQKLANTQARIRKCSRDGGGGGSASAANYPRHNRRATAAARSAAEQDNKLIQTISIDYQLSQTFSSVNPAPFAAPRPAHHQRVQAVDQGEGDPPL